MTKHLATAKRARASSRCGSSTKCWSPERRARQAAAIHRWQPWRRSTGPKTDAGKARVATNALRHGYRSRAWVLKAKRIRHAIRLCARTVLLVRAYMQERDRLALLQSAQLAPVDLGRDPLGCREGLAIGVQNLAPAGEPHAIMPSDVVERLDEMGHAVGRADQERMQRDGQHARLGLALAVERVEGIDDVLAEG